MMHAKHNCAQTADLFMHAKFGIGLERIRQKEWIKNCIVSGKGESSAVIPFIVILRSDDQIGALAKGQFYGQ